VISPGLRAVYPAPVVKPEIAKIPVASLPSAGLIAGTVPVVLS
jgi:hypothetical protein